MTNISEADRSRQTPRIRKRKPEWLKLWEATAPKMRGDKKANHKKLCEMISDAIEDAPYEREGAVWAQPLSQDGWANALGVDVRTFRRYIKIPPIFAKPVGYGSEKAALMRLGEPEEKVDQDYARIMSKIWREFRKIRSTPPSDYGCLLGLAEAWPDGWQTRIFEHTIEFWQNFKILADFEIAIAQELFSGERETVSGEPMPSAEPITEEILFSDDPEDWIHAQHCLETARRFFYEPQRLMKRKYEYPNLGFLRAFEHVALEAYILNKQERGENYPGKEVWVPGN